MKDEIEISYDKVKPLYEKASDSTKDALNRLLIENEIPFLTISSRVKSFDSFSHKIELKKYLNPLEENEDFCGIRIVLFYQDDIEKIDKLLKNEFSVLKSEDKTEKLQHDKFGYRSKHHIVKIKKEWLSTPNYKGLENIKIEIQVRTVLMHAWAEIEHKLGYKNSIEIPPSIKRKLNTISAILEGADDLFLGVKNDIKDIQLKYQDQIHNKHIDNTPFDLEKLQAICDIYISGYERNRQILASVFEGIMKKRITEKEIRKIANKISGFSKMINDRLNSNIIDKSRMTSQANILHYGIEVFYDNNVQHLGKLSNRQKIVNEIKEMVMNTNI